MVAEIVSTLCNQEIAFTAVGPTNAAGSFYKALKAASIKVVDIRAENPILIAHPTREEPGDIAIVGMSGRFPGSESLEDFWRDLEAGRDHVQQVIPDFPVSSLIYANPVEH